MTPARLRRSAVVVGALLLAGCRDTPRTNVLSPTPERAPDTGPARALLVIERDTVDRAATTAGGGTTAGAERDYLATLRVDGAEGTRVGSITAAIDFDTTRVRFLGDASPADAALRAVHVDRGRVRIAAASAVGLTSEALVRLRFATRDTLALRSLRLAVSELHALDAADLARSLSVSAPAFRLVPGGATTATPVGKPEGTP